MIKLRRWVALSGICLSFGLAAHAGASPVVYTLQTVADGKLGDQVFSEAVVTFIMRSDTKYVKSEPGLNGGTRFTNKTGSVEVSVSHDGRTTVAHLSAGEVWVYYDTGTGIAGFGSEISPSYPVSLNCSNQSLPAGTDDAQDCVRNSGNSFSDTLFALANPSPYWYDLETQQLPQTLQASTLLTGGSHTCATEYRAEVCGGWAPRGLKTDRGGLYLMDQVGGTNSVWVGEWGYFYAGWDQSNLGFLQVEVLAQ